MNILYDPATGQILRCSSAPGQVQAGEAELQADAPYGVDATHYVAGEALVPFPARPTAFHDWDWAAKAWVENVDRAREHVRAAWTAWVGAQLAGGCTHEAKPYHADDRFFSELTALVVAADLGLRTPPYTIRRKDNVNEQYATSIALKQLASSVGAHRESAYASSWSAKDQLAGKATVADVLALLPPA